MHEVAVLIAIGLLGYFIFSPTPKGSCHNKNCDCPECSRNR